MSWLKGCVMRLSILGTEMRLSALWVDGASICFLKLVLQASSIRPKINGIDLSS